MAPPAESATGKDAEARKTKAAERDKPDLRPREKAAVGQKLSDAEEAAVPDVKAEAAQAQEDYEAQAQATARAAVSNRTPEPEPGEPVDVGLVNDAGQLVEPEVLEIQERQKQELADRVAAADEERQAANKQAGKSSEK